MYHQQLAIVEVRQNPRFLSWGIFPERVGKRSQMAPQPGPKARPHSETV